MSTLEVFFVAAVVVAFVIFAAALAWGWSQTKDLT
jgi:hypothetical protein